MRKGFWYWKRQLVIVCAIAVVRRIACPDEWDTCHSLGRRARKGDDMGRILRNA